MNRRILLRRHILSAAGCLLVCRVVMEVMQGFAIRGSVFQAERRYLRKRNVVSSGFTSVI